MCERKRERGRIRSGGERERGCVCVWGGKLSEYETRVLYSGMCAHAVRAGLHYETKRERRRGEKQRKQEKRKQLQAGETTESV